MTPKTKGRPASRPRETEDKGKKKYLIWFNRDTGHGLIISAYGPIEPVPFGYHVLPYEGSWIKMKMILRRISQNTFKTTGKFSVL